MKDNCNCDQNKPGHIGLAYNYMLKDSVVKCWICHKKVILTPRKINLSSTGAKGDHLSIKQ